MYLLHIQSLFDDLGGLAVGTVGARGGVSGSNPGGPILERNFF